MSDALSWTVIVFAIVILTVISFSILVKIEKKYKINVGADTPYETAKQTLDRVYNWIMWMMGLQTAAIGAIGLLMKDKSYTIVTDGPKATEHITRVVNNMSSCSKDLALVTLTVFGISIIMATTVFSSLASIQQRLTYPVAPDIAKTSANDVFCTGLYSNIKIRMGTVLTMVHIYFILGLILFASFVFLLNIS